jgi:hypothetical protein
VYRTSFHMSLSLISSGETAQSHGGFLTEPLFVREIYKIVLVYYFIQKISLRN